MGCSVATLRHGMTCKMGGSTVVSTGLMNLCMICNNPFGLPIIDLPNHLDSRLGFPRIEAVSGRR